jgi:hypothetical protein
MIYILNISLSIFNNSLFSILNLNVKIKNYEFFYANEMKESLNSL